MGKKFEASQFNQGIVNLVQPDKIDTSAVVDALDADLTHGGIRPFKGETETQVTTDFLDLQGNEITKSLVKWVNTWYWTDNVSGEFSSELGYVGVNPPTSIPSLKVGAPGDRFVGTYKYMTTFITADGFESAPYPAGNSMTFAEISTRTEDFTIENESLDTFSPSRMYPLDGHRNGYINGDRVNWSGFSWLCKQNFVGQTEADYAAGTAPRYLPIQSWQYPGEDNPYWENISSIITTVNGTQEIKLKNIPQPDSNYVTGVNLYRTIADGNDFYLVTKLDVGVTQFDDSLDDSLLLVSTFLNLSSLGYPPIYEEAKTGEFIQKNAKYLTESNGTFFVAVDDRLYLSDAGNPHSWQMSKYLVYDDIITGIAQESTGVLVFTRNSTYLVTGTDWQTINSHRLPVAQGCTDWRTISYLRNSPVWMSNDGLCRYAYEPNINGKILLVITQGRYEFLTGYLFSLVANDIYYLFYSDFAVCIDFRHGSMVYRRGLTALLADYDAERDVVVMKKTDGKYYVVDSGSDLEWSLTTKEYLFDFDDEKFLRSMWINVDNDITVEIIIDDESVDTGTTSGGKYLVGEFGKKFQFKLSGKAELRSIIFEIQEG